MGCSGRCGPDCCGSQLQGMFPFVPSRRRRQLGEVQQLPGGLFIYCGEPECPPNQCALTPGGECFDMSNPNIPTPPQTDPSQPWSPMPGTPFVCGPPNCPPNECAWIPGGPCFPTHMGPGTPLPPGTPSVPGFPDPQVPDVPGLVTEQECAAQVDAAKRAEEGKTIKYAAIGAVASGVVGVILGRLFK